MRGKIREVCARLGAAFVMDFTNDAAELVLTYGPAKHGDVLLEVLREWVDERYPSR